MPIQKNILILGGAGFLGSHLCERLLMSGANVICIDNFVTSGENNINHLLRQPRFEFIKHNLTEQINLETVPDLIKFKINVFGIQEIYNLACPTSVKNFKKLKKETVLANSTVLINGLELAVKYKAKFMHFSSSVVYGEVKRGQYIAEDYRGLSDMLNDRACYDEGKRYAESIVETYREKHNLDTKIARIFRTYGPRMLLNDGQMIPDFIVNALENKDLIIFGTNKFQTSLSYVSDIIEGCIKLMDAGVNEPVNFGNQEIYKIVDVAKQIIELTGSTSKIIFNEPKSFMRELALPDISKVKAAIGWFPIVSVGEGLQKTIDYTRAHKDLLMISAEE